MDPSEDEETSSPAKSAAAESAPAGSASTESASSESASTESAPEKPKESAAEESAPEKPEESASRVLDAGTSQELVIVNYADDSFLHPRHKELAGQKKADDPEPEAEPVSDGSLVIVRDSFALQNMQPPDSATFTPPSAPARPPAPSSATTSSATSNARPSSDDLVLSDMTPPLDDVVPSPSEASGQTAGPREGARPSWARSETSGAFPPPPPLPKPAPPPLPPRPASPVPASRPPSAVRPPSTVRNAEDMFVQPDFSKKRTQPRGESTAQLAPAKSRKPSSVMPPAPEPPAKRMAAPAPPPTRKMAPPPPLPPDEPLDELPLDEAELDATPRRRAAAPSAPLASSVVTMLACILFAGAATLSVLKVEPFYTWFYLFAWVPFLLTLNHFTAMRSRAHSVFTGRIATVGTLAAWSVPVWLVFELLNFRLEDWYYVGVPDAWFARRIGVALSFATVLPGLFFLEELQCVRGAFAGLRTPPFELTEGLQKGLFRAGLICLALILALPTFFFALAWGVPVLLLEPWLARKGAKSLLGELATGRPGRILRLLIAGIGCGIFWEASNFVAGGKWIYTVPGFAHFKLFEMPLLGFVGFAPFALACWSMARALVTLGLLPEWIVVTRASGVAPAPTASGDLVGGLAKGTRLSLVAWTVLVSLAVLEGMDRWTVDSRTPRPEDVPRIPDGVAQYAHEHGFHDVRGLLTLIADGRLHIPGASSERELAQLQDRCNLVLLRGIGTANARRLDTVGVHGVADLAGRDATALAKALQGVERGWMPRPRRVAVWVDAARHATAR